MIATLTPYQALMECATTEFDGDFLVMQVRPSDKPSEFESAEVYCLASPENESWVFAAARKHNLRVSFHEYASPFEDGIRYRAYTIEQEKAIALGAEGDVPASAPEGVA